MAQALTGGNPEFFAGKAGASPTASSLFTTTSQYRLVGILPTSTTNDLEFFLANTSTILPIGVCYTDMTASSAPPIQVKLHGIAKVTCNDTITAGDFVVRSGAGLIAPLELAGLTVTAASLSTQLVSPGYALQTGVTNQAIAIMIAPQFIERTYVLT